MRTFPRARRAPSKKSMMPSIMKSAPNDVSPTPISDIRVGLMSFLIGGKGKVLVFILTLHVC